MAASFAAGTSRAVPAPVTLTVHIVDSSGAPIWLAQATIYGPKNLIAESNRNGDAFFPRIPSATYRLRVVRYGYDLTDIARIVATRAENSVVIRMVKAKSLTTIASVTAKATPEPPNEVSADGTQAQLGDSLTSAVASLPGVTVGPGNNVSIRGYSAAQTTVGINGVPVSLPGTAQNLSLFNADVFSGASVSPGVGGGGMVGFQTRSPSLAWQGVARAVVASGHGEDIALQEAGTVGDLGVSYSHARNVVSDPLDGKSFLDTSGLFYAHDASAAVNGDAMQLRYEFSQDNTLLATVVSLGSTIPLVCRVQTGVLPCGYGPTNLQHESLQTLQLKDSAQLGDSSVDLTVYANHSINAVDQGGYYVDGVNEPSSSIADSHQSGAIAQMHVRAGKSFVLPLNISTNSVETSTSGSAFGPLLPSVLSRYSSIDASTSLPIVHGKTFGVNANLGLQSNAVVGARATGVNGALNASYQLGRNDGLSASYSPGNLGAPSAGFVGVSAPAELQFVCASNVGIGLGPSSQTKSATQTTTSASWSHHVPGWTSQVSVYRNVQFNAPISATVGALGLDPSLFGGDYLSQAQQAAHAACGGSRPLGLGDLFYNVSGVANRAIYSGAEVSVNGQVRRGLRANLSYATTFARAFGSDPLLFGPRSTVIAGRQLPNVPRHAANLSFNAALGSRLAALVQTSYWSGNNSYNLPAYVTFDAGILAQAPRGLLSVTITNIGNAHAGPFATVQGAVPLTMLDGSFPTIAQPLAPRTLRVGYRFHIGLPERQPTFAVPSDQYQRPGVSFSFMTRAAFEAGIPKDPFAIDRQSVSCGPKDVTSAQRVLSDWRAYAQSAERARTNGAYPDYLPPFLDDAIVFTYKKNGNSYVILPAPAAGAMSDFFRQFRPIEACAVVHGGDDAEIANRHLFEYPPGTSMDSPDFLIRYLPMYAPEVGLYQTNDFVFGSSASDASALAQPENVGFTGEEAAAPKGQPFALNSWAHCSPELQSPAQEILDAIKDYAHAYFDLHEHPKGPDGLRIVPHVEASGKAWLEIQAEDLDSLPPLSQCMYLHTYMEAAAERKGLDGVRAPELNYAPELGLYQVF